MAHPSHVKIERVIVRAWKWWFTPRTCDPTVTFREQALRILLPLLTILRPLSIYATYRAGNFQGQVFFPLPLDVLFFIVPILISYYALFRQKIDLACLLFFAHWYLSDLASLPIEGYWYAGYQISLIIQIVLASLLLRSSAIVPFALFQLVSVIGFGAWLDANWYSPPLLQNGQPLTTFPRAATTLAAQEIIILLTVRFLRTEMEKHLRLQQTTIVKLEDQMAERQRTEAALRESEMRFRGLLENIPVITYLIGMGQEPFKNPTIYVSPQIAKFSGYTLDQFAQDPFLWTKLVHPDDLARVLAESEYADQTGGPLVSDYRALGKERRVFWFHDESVLVKDDHGQPLFRVGVWTDITERKRAEQEMQQRLREMAAVNEISQGLTAQLELQATLKFVADKLLQTFDIQALYIALYNAEANLLHFLYWYVDGETVQTEPAPPGGLTRVIIQTRQPLLIDQDYERHFAELGGAMLRPPGRQRPRAWLGVPMYARNEFIGVISVINYEHEQAFVEADVRLLATIGANVGIAIQNAQLYAATQQELAERKRIQLEREQLIAELEARNAELERFTYAVSHDLKAPLVTVRGFLGFVEKDARSGNWDRFTADVARIVEATDKMQRLLSELLELLRIGRMMNPPQTVPFEAVVREALELVHGRIEARGVQVDIAPDLPTVYGDRARLVEVVQNLVDNAAKFMGDQSNPRIEIGARSARGADADGKLIFFVRDNGIGLEPQYHDKVFGLFNKLDAQSGGTGVGLALVKRIVEVHGGKIWVESDGAGRGATFCFTLSMAKVD